MYLKKGIKNILFALLSQLISIILGIIIPRLFITSFGSEINGLISSITQIFVILGLFEAGVGTATLVALYGPVSQDNKQSISRILAATHDYFKKSSMYYLLSILLFAVIYPFLISTGVDKITIVLVIILIGLPGTVSFLLQNTYNLLLQAEGKAYILTNLGIIVNILTNISRIILLVMGANVVVVQSSYALFHILQMLFINYYIKKNYSWINLKSKPDREAISSKNSVLVHNISFLIFNNTDIIMLTIFCDLKVVSVYALYALLFRMIRSVIESFLGGFKFSLGQAFNSNKSNYLKMNDTFEVYYLALVFALYAIAFVFILPFMRLYTADITDINYIDQYLPYLFILTFLLSNGRETANQAISFANLFKQTQWRTILESAINLVVSVVMVNLIGRYGVLVGTAAALLYRSNDMIIYASKQIWNRSPWVTYRRWLVNFVLFSFVLFAARYIPMDLHSYAQIALWAILFCIIVIPLFIAVNLRLDKQTRDRTIMFIKPRLQRLFRTRQS